MHEHMESVCSTDQEKTITSIYWEKKKILKGELQFKML